jgi:arabinose-5-phosphate isomerase
MLKHLFQKAHQALDTFFNTVHVADAEKLLDMLAACSGVIHFTGVGKSGLVAKKIAVTMTSCGTRATFISPMDALHGDLGIVRPEDLVIIFSKSGESDELLALVPALRNKGVKIASIVCAQHCRLAKASDFTFYVAPQPELCPFGMAPTTSTITQMLIGDVLTIGLMERKKFTLDEYATNHPAGQIGKRTTMRVEDLMVKGVNIPSCSPDSKLVDTLVELSKKRCGCVLVADKNQKLLGIFTDGDLRRALQDKGGSILEHLMHELMTKAAKTIGPKDLAWKAMQVMEGDQKNAITVLPVLDHEDKIVGLIKLHDIIQSGV